MRILFVAALLLAAASAPAQPQTRTSTDHGEDQLRFTLILSRHGIRPPLVPAARLDLRSSSPWPKWEVPLGDLTPHGALAMRQMGAYMRLDFASNGLLPATGCPTSGEIYLYSDTNERNIESTRNTFAGLEPGCAPLPIDTIASGPRKADTLFSPIPGAFPPPPKEAIAADRQAAMGNDPTAFFSFAANPELKEFAPILSPDPAHPAAKPLLEDGSGPLAAASGLIEDILLEYVDDKPMSEVGWGRVDEPTLRRLIPLHTRQFALGTRTPLAVRTGSSNLMAHILDTLEQAAQSPQAQAVPKAVPGAIGPIGARLVYLSGHDTNLFGVGGLLGLHWTVDGRTDGVPPDSQLVFELWQDPKSKQYTVRLRYRAQTLDQLRSASAMNLKNPPAEVYLTPPGCTHGRSCPFADFDRAVHGLLDPAYIQPTLMPTQIAPDNMSSLTATR